VKSGPLRKAPVGLNPHSSVSRTGSRAVRIDQHALMLTPFGVLREPHIASGGKPGLGQRAGIPDKQVGRRPAVRSCIEVRLYTALYERVGFIHEGRRVGCLLIDGKFLDELYMAMILPGSLSP
jgi:hypothetical protein